MHVEVMTATEKCERVLKESRDYNVEHSILASENLVIARLLANSESMGHVYTELCGSLDKRQIGAVLSAVLSSAAFWNPEKAASYRADRKELIETNREIAEVARKLSGLLTRREELHNHSGFSSDTHYDIVDVIDKASESNGLYRGYVREPLTRLGGRFDLKYWPSIEEVIVELAVDAEKAGVYATDPLTEASTSSSRPSKIDFLRALFSALDENSEREFGLVPAGFSLSDRSIAEIMNCALKLEPEELVDAGYVKRERQRQREKRKGTGCEHG